MGVQTYSAQQRRAVNLIWAAAGEYGFEPKFLAMKTDGTPDFYMNFVIGLVYKWFGRDMLERLFDSWLGDVRQAVMDDLAWLALESAVYQKELPGRPALEAMELSFVWSDVLTDLERAADHCCNIMECVADLSAGNRNLHASQLAVRQRDPAFDSRVRAYEQKYRI